jgi:hypothetical protein
VDDGDVVQASWGDAVRLAVTELQAAPPAHGSTHQPGGADALPTAAAGASAVGDTAAAGSSTSLARADHRHSREAFGSPAVSTPGQAAADGTASTVSRSDHKHQRTDGYGAGSNPVNNAPDGGVNGNVSRADHRHALFGDAVAIAAGSSGSIAAGADANVTLNWGTALAAAASYGFPSAELNADCAPPTMHVKSMTSTQVIVRIRNNDASARTFSLRVLGIR